MNALKTVHKEFQNYKCLLCTNRTKNTLNNHFYGIKGSISPISKVIVVNRW